MNFLSKVKSIFIPDCDNKVELEGLETWMVTWNSRYGHGGIYTKIVGQAFTNKHDAEKFANYLIEAFELIKNPVDIESIKLEKM